MAKGQAERLMPFLEEMLRDQGLGWGDLSALGVGIGPGNFTGIRIAVAAARGLALGLGVPAVGVSGFEAAAYGLARPVTVLLPAPRDQVYRQDLGEGRAAPPELLAGADLPPGLAAAPPCPPEASVQAMARIAAERLARVGAQAIPRPAPLYVRGPDAAPPRDPAPRLLP